LYLASCKTRRYPHDVFNLGNRALPHRHRCPNCGPPGRSGLLTAKVDSCLSSNRLRGPRLHPSYASHRSAVIYAYSSTEKQYAHYLGEASWAGARVILGQWTPFTEKLYDLLILTFSENGTITDIDALKEKSGLSEDEWDRVLEFASQVNRRSSDVVARSFSSSLTIYPGANQSRQL
jgi:hypothetical protein